MNTTVAFLMLNHYICKYIDVDEHTNSIKNLIAKLKPLIDKLFELSVSLIKEKEYAVLKQPIMK